MPYRNTFRYFIEKLHESWRTENKQVMPVPDPPTVDELRDWLVEHAPDEVRQMCVDRIQAILARIPSLKQRPGLKDVEGIHALWLEAGGNASEFLYPLGPVLKAYLERPRLVGIHDAAEFLPVRIAQRVSSVNIGGKRQPPRLFSLPSHIDQQADGEQIALASHDFAPSKHPRLPEEFLRIGLIGGEQGGQAVSVAMRALIAGLAVRPRGMQNGQFRVETRHFFSRVFAGRQGIPRGRRWKPQMWRASEILDSAWIPSLSPDTEKAVALRLLLIHELPRDLDNTTILLSIALPDGPDKGAPITPRLHEYAATERRAFYAMLQLSYDWWQPGRTRIPSGKRESDNWAQLTNAGKPSVLDRYGHYDRKGVENLTQPFNSNKRKSDAFTNGIATMVSLDERGEIQGIEHGSGIGKSWWFLPTKEALPVIEGKYRRIA